MGSRASLVYGLHASASFAGGAGGGAFLQQRGFAAAFVRNGAGDYSLQTTDAIDATGKQHICFATTADGAVNANIDVVIVDATHIRVRTGVAGVLTDMTFNVMIVDQGVA